MTGADDSVRDRMSAVNLSEKIAKTYYDDLGRLVRFSFREEISQDFFFALPEVMMKMPDFVFQRKVDHDEVYLVEVKGCKQNNLKLKVRDFFHYDSWEIFTGLKVKLFIVDYVNGNIFEIPFWKLKQIFGKQEIRISRTSDGVNWFEINYSLLKEWKVKEL